MKKLFCLMLALFMCASLFAGCAGEKPLPIPEPTPEPTPESIPVPEQIEGTAFAFSRDNMPRMDGSTSLVPLAQAASAVLLGESREAVEDITRFNRTTQSYRNLMKGDCDILIASWPAESVFGEMEAEGFKWEMAPIATDALIFVVNENNPINNLSTEDIIGIYTGEIKNWSQLGGADEPIAAFQRNSGAGSQALMEKLVMGDIPMMEAPSEFMAGSMGELMEYVKSYDNSAGAIGYSVYYYAEDMRMADGLKIISVDGVEPNDENIRAGDYPHLSNYYTVIAADAPADSPQRIMYEWLQGAEGQRLALSEGYVAVKDLTDAPEREATPGGYVVETHWDALEGFEAPSTKFTRLREEWMDTLEARDDYGRLYPFVSSVNYDEWGGQKPVYGLFDASGRIVCDGVFSEVNRLGYYSVGQENYVPMLGLAKAVDEYTMDYTVASLDGSFVAPGTYQTVRVFDFGVLLAENYHSSAFTVYDFEGNVILTEADLQLGELELSSAGEIFDGRDGLYLVWLRHGDEESKAYLLNSDGSILDGGWASAEFMGEGRILVRSSWEGGVGLMDYEGNWIIRDVHDSLQLNGEHYVGVSRDRAVIVYDRDGNEVLLLGYETQLNAGGYLDKGKFYRPDGSSFALEGEWNAPYIYSGCPVIYKTENGSTTIMNVISEDTLTVEGSAWVEPLMVSFVMGPYSRLEYLLVWSDEGDEPCRLVSWDLQKSYEFEDASLGMAAFSTFVDGFTGEEYVVVNNADYSRVLYSGEMEFVAGADDWTGVWNGLIYKTDDRFCCYWDENGDVLFCYPLAVGAGD